MNTLTEHNQHDNYQKNKAEIWGVALVLVTLMIITRGSHFGDSFNLPDASQAIFFLAGTALAARKAKIWLFPLLMFIAALIDYIAINNFGVSSFCVTPAYVMLIPAYSALGYCGYLAINSLKNQHKYFSIKSILMVAVFAVIGAFVAELFASGGFYFLGGRFTQPTLAGFLPRLQSYFPHMLITTLGYSAIVLFAYGILNNIIDMRKKAYI